MSATVWSIGGGVLSSDWSPIQLDQFVSDLYLKWVNTETTHNGGRKSDNFRQIKKTEMQDAAYNAVTMRRLLDKSET